MGRNCSGRDPRGGTDLCCRGERGNGDDETDDVETLVVTGTRLDRQISGAPVHVITREEMAARGIALIEDAVRSLPQNFSEVNAAATLDNSLNSVGTIGQSSVDLRALGRGSLVLVNGRRWVQSSTFGDGTVNLNGIPFNAVERIEVLADGASAIYGADAQAGVINFILRSNFVGGETSVRQDIGANDGDVLRFDQTLGLTWDGGQAMAVVGYQENEAVNRQKAGLTTLDFRPLGGADQRGTFATQPGKVGYGFPGSFFQFITLGSLPAGDDGTQGVAARLSPADVTPYDSALNGATAVSDTLTAYLQVSQALRGGTVELYGELNYAERIPTPREPRSRASSRSHTPTPTTTCRRSRLSRSRSATSLRRRPLRG
ncbi:MAG: TonB-dependent receptor plug domain-containing protein [Gammaproteobacteria bacterium]|nr:TonB-dependent receptor plug domain-containing protein [Gammaproteobacteria bacterium]